MTVHPDRSASLGLESLCSNRFKTMMPRRHGKTQASSAPSVEMPAGFLILAFELDVSCTPSQRSSITNATRNALLPESADSATCVLGD